MKLRLPVLLYGVVAVAALVWAYSWWTSDARRIERQLARLQELLEKDGSESNLVAAASAKELGDLFTPSFEVRLLPLNQVLGDRGQLLRIVLQYRSGPSHIGIAFDDRELAVDERRREAEMDLVATVTARRDGSLSRERYRLHFSWSEEGGTWLLRQVDLVEILEGPAGLL